MAAGAKAHGLVSAPKSLSLSTDASRVDQQQPWQNPQLTCLRATRFCLHCCRLRELSAASSPGCQASRRPLDAPHCMACRLPVDALSNRQIRTGSHCVASLLQLTGLQVAVSSTGFIRFREIACAADLPAGSSCIKSLDLWLPDTLDGIADNGALMRWALPSTSVRQCEVHTYCIDQGSVASFVGLLCKVADTKAAAASRPASLQGHWQPFPKDIQVSTRPFTPADARAPGGRTGGFPSLVQETFPLPSMVRVTMSSDRCLASFKPWMPP